MAKIVVERQFDEPISAEVLQKAEDEAQWCLDLYNVTFLHTYFSADKKRMICVYEAPDAEAVRSAQRQANLPFETVWKAHVIARPE